jgi:hypothetical protein
VLGIPQDRIDRRDHFFDRGGTSLSAVKPAIALNRAVSLKDVTRHRVPADQARLVDGRSERSRGLLQPVSECEYVDFTDQGVRRGDRPPPVTSQLTP